MFSFALLFICIQNKINAYLIFDFKFLTQDEHENKYFLEETEFVKYVNLGQNYYENMQNYIITLYLIGCHPPGLRWKHEYDKEDE